MAQLSPQRRQHLTSFLFSTAVVWSVAVWSLPSWKPGRHGLTSAFVAHRIQSKLPISRRRKRDSPADTIRQQRLVGSEVLEPSHAIILGGSIAGLLAARVLTRLGWRVTIIEKDVLQERPHSNDVGDVVSRLKGRPGTPQARHIHTLLPGGAAALNAFFPSFTDELVQNGGERTSMMQRFRFNIGGLWLGADPTTSIGAARVDTILCSRVLIEECIRRRVSGLPDVNLRSGVAAIGLLGEAGVVKGVRLRGGETLHASLVVDASGRGSRCSRWVSEVGGVAPEEDVVDCRITYADALMRPSPEDVAAARDWRVLRVDDGPGQGHHSGIIYEIEHGLWLVGLAGYFGKRPPQDKQDWLKYARELADPTITRLIERAEFLSPVSRIAATRNIRRRWETVSDDASGFVALGDALCAPNPIYGQGMTMACFEAIAMETALTGYQNYEPDHSARPLPSDVCRRIHVACAKAAESSWDVASGVDQLRLNLESNLLLQLILKPLWAVVGLFRPKE